MEKITSVKIGVYRRIFKRPMDLLISLLAIILLLPLFTVLAILIRIKLGSPILFIQKRPGKNEKIFKMYKFRTMTTETDSNGNLLPDVERMTKLGKFLRSTSLDELPELFNVLMGHMSIVGPRPLLEQYLPLYNLKQKQRHDVSPGLTGLAQINGRNALSWPEKFELDINYINNITFLGDLKILIKTINKVLKREGISSETSETTEPFKGN